MQRAHSGESCAPELWHQAGWYPYQSQGWRLGDSECQQRSSGLRDRELVPELHAKKQVIQRSHDVVPVGRQLVPDVAQVRGGDGRQAGHKQNVVDP